jgi:hypothetical protein
MLSIKDMYREVESLVGRMTVDAKKRSLEAIASGDPAYYKGHPQDGKAVWIVSRHNDERSTTEGAVCLATLRLAALRIVEGTHAIASPEQIKAHLDAQAEHASLIAALERKNAFSRLGASDAQ